MVDEVSKTRDNCSFFFANFLFLFILKRGTISTNLSIFGTDDCFRQLV